MDLINEIREQQKQIILTINTAFDELVKKVEKININEENVNIEYESEYPITNTTVFKGKKPIAVKMKGKRIITPTWKSVVKVILQEVLKDEQMKKRILDLRDRILGHKRTRISDREGDMRSPLQLCDDLFIETHYDTETLMNLLLQILEGINYNYNDIAIFIKN